MCELNRAEPQWRPTVEAHTVAHTHTVGNSVARSNDRFCEGFWRVETWLRLGLSVVLAADETARDDRAVNTYFGGY